MIPFKPLFLQSTPSKSGSKFDANSTNGYTIKLLSTQAGDSSRSLACNGRPASPEDPSKAQSVNRAPLLTDYRRPSPLQPTWLIPAQRSTSPKRQVRAFSKVVLRAID